MVVAAFVFSLCTPNPRRMAGVLIFLFCALILLAPGLALLVQMGVSSGWQPPHGLAVWLQPYLLWADLIRTEGPRLFTGHGFDMTIRGLASGYLPTQMPRSILFEIWFDLGIVGALGLTMLVALGFRAAGRLPSPVAPFMLAGITCIMVVALSGLASMQLWWITLVCVATISFTCVVNGQPRSARPAARVVTDGPARPRL
jgi:hypothetical protein